MKIQQDFKVICQFKCFTFNIFDTQMEMKKQEQTILEERNQRMRMETAISGK